MQPNADRPPSLSEYGCNKNTRKFEEVASLYGDNMTPVYSGGLVYEYSQEASNYGLVTISGSSVSERPDFTALKTALANTPPPSGDGGARTSDGSASTCPPKSSTWEVDTTDLPAMPKGALAYMQHGAGAGPGLQGKGSQNAGNSAAPSAGSGSSASQSGSPSSASDSAAATSSNAAAGGPAGALRGGATQFVCVAAALVSVFAGAASLF